MAATSRHSRTLTAPAAAFLTAFLTVLACLIVAAPAALATPGAQLWVSRYNTPGNGNEDGNEFAQALVVSPDGSKVFVTGDRRPPVGSPGGADFATVAYDASTGAPLWAKHYNGAPNRGDNAADLAVSPDGTKVFVTGTSNRSTSGADYATVAYDASTGARLWVRRFNGPASRDDAASAVGVGPGGARVFVTGSSKWSTNPRFGHDYATVAYDAGSGARLWVQRYKNGPGNYDDIAGALGVSPDGSKVFVTGQSDGLTNSKITTDYATVAYRASSGAQLWVRRYNGPGNSDDLARALGVSPNGSKVFVTGNSAGAASNDYATAAYNASSGAPLWVRRYNGTGNFDDFAFALGVSPDGSQVFVTGYSWGSTSSFDYATLAHNASTGARLWVRRHDGPANGEDFATALGVSTDGSKLFVTGGSPGSTTSGQDFGTLAYSIP